MIYPPVLWAGAAVAWAISAWTIVATTIEVVRGGSKPWNRDVIIGVIFHGGTALLALRLAIWASHHG